MSGATGYNVKRSTSSGGPYTTVGPNVTPASFTDSGLTNGTTYYYVVSALNAGGESANSAQVSATPAAPPGAPTNVTATAGNAQVTLSWTAVSGATGYNVKRSTTSGGPYTTVGPNVTPTSFTDSGLTNGTTYYYVVSALNAGGESANSAQVSATPVVPLSTLTLSPTTVIGGGTSTGTVTLTAPAPTGGATVTLSSSNTAAATVPGSVLVAAGASTATFTVTSKAVTASTAVTISATYGITKTAILSSGCC